MKGHMMSNLIDRCSGVGAGASVTSPEGLSLLAPALEQRSIYVLPNERTTK